MHSDPIEVEYPLTMSPGRTLGVIVLVVALTAGGACVAATNSRGLRIAPCEAVGELPLGQLGLPRPKNGGRGGATPCSRIQGRRRPAAEDSELPGAAPRTKGRAAINHALLATSGRQVAAGLLCC
jgi:hypothetical protein